MMQNVKKKKHQNMSQEQIVIQIYFMSNIMFNLDYYSLNFCCC